MNKNEPMTDEVPMTTDEVPDKEFFEHISRQLAEWEDPQGPQPQSESSQEPSRHWKALHAIRAEVDKELLGLPEPMEEEDF